MTASRIARAALVAVVLIGLIAAPQYLSRSGVYNLSTWAVFAIAALGLNLTLGYAGQVSLAQGAFVGVGAYASGLLLAHGMPIVVPIVLAAIACCALGWLLGFPALRVQHHYLAFVTLAFSTLAFLVFRNEIWLTNGIQGISGLDAYRPDLFSWAAPKGRSGREVNYYYFCLCVLAVVSVAVWWLVHSPWGRAFMALRENPVRAQSLGIDTRAYTLMAFAIGSGLGGIAGALYSPLVGIVEPTSFQLDLSLKLLLMVIVGGSGFFSGPYLGAMIAVLLPEWLRSDWMPAAWKQFADSNYLILYSALVMLLLVISPTGIIGIVDRFISERKTRAASAARAKATSMLEGTSR
jgi:branched-chain amino acid transport system permease protein